MKIVVGLGNPDKKYIRTFHNMGFMVLEAAAQKLDIKIKKSRSRSLIAEANFKGEKFVFALPQTYMNLSGEAVLLLLDNFKASIDDLLIVYDDCDLDAGVLRLRTLGSAGTHNGMKSIITCLKTENFKRLRVGIGKPPVNYPLADYVLSDIPEVLRQTMFDAIIRASDCVIDWLSGVTFDNVMQNYNG